MNKARFIKVNNAPIQIVSINLGFPSDVPIGINIEFANRIERGFAFNGNFYNMDAFLKNDEHLISAVKEFRNEDIIVPEWASGVFLSDRGRDFLYGVIEEDTIDLYTRVYEDEETVTLTIESKHLDQLEDALTNALELCCDGDYEDADPKALIALLEKIGCVEEAAVYAKELNIG